MGNNCPCFEGNYVYFGEIINNHNQNQNYNRNHHQIESLKNMNNSPELTNTYINEQKIILENDKNKIKTSIYTNFKNGNPSLNNNFSKRTNLMESLQSKNSDIYFESFSLSNLKGDGSLMIDYYQLSKNIFDLLNEIRINPKESSKEYLTKTNNINIKFENLKSGDIILWNEKVYLCCSSYLFEVEEKCKNISTVKKSASERVSERLNNKCNVVEFCVDGLGTPKVILSKLLYENFERIQLLISDNYLCGAICCFPCKGVKNMRTIVYLVNIEN